MGDGFIVRVVWPNEKVEHRSTVASRKNPGLSKLQARDAAMLQRLVQWARAYRSNILLLYKIQSPWLLPSTLPTPRGTTHQLRYASYPAALASSLFSSCLLVKHLFPTLHRVTACPVNSYVTFKNDVILAFMGSTIIYAFLSVQKDLETEYEVILKRAKTSQGTGPILVPNPKAKLLEQVREVMRFHHYSIRTERTYCQWIRRYLAFHRLRDWSGPQRGWRHPRDMGAPEVVAFLTHLAVAGNVAASTQNQALNALVFLYEQVLLMPLGDLGEFARVTRPPRLPVVLTQEETLRVLAALKPGTGGLIIRLLYGTGMRLMECLRLRIKDLDLACGRITVREGKGDKDRTTMLPECLKAELQTHLDRVRLLHEKDLAEGFGRVYLPHALDRKYPNAHRTLAWQWVFPAKGLSKDPRTGIIRRHHVHELAVQRIMKEAVHLARLKSRRPAILCAIASRRICWRINMISGPCKSCWGMRMWPPLRFTPM